MEVLQFSAAELTAWLGTFIWPLFRIMGFLLAVPIIGSNFVPMRVRVILAVCLALVVAPTLGPMPEVEGLSVAAFLVVLQQLLIGAALGFFLQLLLQLFILTGQMIAMQMGLGFAAMMDPANGVNVTVLSTFYMMLVSLLFITMDGHLVMLEILVESFTTLPVGFTGLSADVIMQIVSTISWAFSSALVLALPAVTALLLTNLAFGIMTRAAPQLNIFALGFPMALMLGLFIIWVLMGSILDSIEGLFGEMFMMMRELIQ